MTPQDMLAIKKEERRKLREAQDQTMREEQKEVVQELKKIGINVDLLRDLKSYTFKKHQDKKAIEILKKYISTEFSYLTKIDLYQVFQTIGNKDDDLIEALLNQFIYEDNSHARFQLGVTLNNIVSNDKFVPNVLEIITNASLGSSRTELVHLYAKLAKKEATPVLIKLLQERSVTAETLVALGKLKAVEALDEVKTYTQDEDSWIRGKAKAAYKKIQNAAEVSPSKLKASKFADAVQDSLKHEASMGFDIEQVGPFLRGLSRKFKFKLQVKAMEDFVCNIEFEQTKGVFVDIDDNGRKTAMHFEVFMDDENTPDLYFFFDNAELAEKTQDYMEEWAEKNQL